MPISAKFQADFSSFQDAVQKAEVKLKDLTSGADKVIPSLTRIGNSLSGTKLIQDATLMAQAVDKVGGVSTLTEKELQRVGAQAQEAAEKMTKLGIGVPENLQKIADAAKPATSWISNLGSEIAKTAAGFVSAQAVIGLATKGFDLLKDAVVGSIEFASKLDDMSKATNIGVESLQELGFAGKRVGLELEDIGNMVGQLSKRLATGDASAVGAVQSLGINLDQLKAQKPEEQFIQIAEAVGKISDPLAQAGIGSELFGKQFQGVLRLANDNLRETMQQAKDAGAVLGVDAVKSLDTFGDKVGDIMLRVKVATASALTPFVDKLLELMTIGEQTKGVTFIDPAAQAQFEKYGLAATGASDALKGFGLQLEVTGQAAKDLASGHGQILSSADLVSNRLKALRADALEPLSRQQQQQILELKAWGESEKTIAQLVGASEQAVHRFIDGNQKATESLKAMRKELATIEAGKALNMEWLPLADTQTIVQLQSYLETTAKVATVEHEAFGPTIAFMDGIENVGQKAAISKDELERWYEVVRFVGPTLADAKLGVLSFSQAIGHDLMDALKSVPQTLASAFTGGGGLLGGLEAVGSQLGSALGKGIGKSISGLGSLGGPIGAAIGSLAGPLIDAIANIGGPSKAEVAGRKTEAQFEQQFKSFNDMVTSIGKAYVAVGKTADQAQADVAALLAAERQGPAATQAWVDALQGTLDRAATLSSEASSRFGPSKTDLQKLAKDASDVYQYMLKQGTFTADQLAAAFKASQEAQAKSLGINTEATQKNLDALNKGLEDLTSKRDSLWQQVSQEAPEEVMGVIETAQRTQLGVLDDQIAAQKLAIEKEAADAADALKRALEGIEPDPIHIPYTWVPTNDFPHAPDLPPVFPQAAGGDYIVTRPTLFLAGEAGAERATFTPHGGSSSGDIAALSAAIARLPRTISRSIRDALVGMNG